MWRNLILISLAGLVACAVYLYLHLGLNRKIEIREEKAGPFYLLYKEHRGAYHQIGPVISAVELWAAKNNVTCPRTFGLYIDSPESLDQDRLRSWGGCVLETPLTKAPPEDFLVKEIPEKNYVTARFDGSPAAGPLTAYPAVEKYGQTQRIRLATPVMEIYTVNGPAVSTEYLFERL